MKSLWSGTALSVALLAGGCSVDRSPPSAQEEAVAKTGAAAPVERERVEIATLSGTFWFVPRRCNVGVDPDRGVTEFSIEGAGQAPDGQPIYVTAVDEDGDPHNSPEIRINVGTDRRMRTPDLVWIANDESAHSLRVPAARATVEGQTVTVTGAAFIGNGDDLLTVTAPIRFNCAP